MAPVLHPPFFLLCGAFISFCNFYWVFNIKRYFWHPPVAINIYIVHAILDIFSVENDIHNTKSWLYRCNEIKIYLKCFFLCVACFIIHWNFLISKIKGKLNSLVTDKLVVAGNLLLCTLANLKWALTGLTVTDNSLLPLVRPYTEYYCSLIQLKIVPSCTWNEFSRVASHGLKRGINCPIVLLPRVYSTSELCNNSKCAS